MAGIANGHYLPKLHLVRQMLDIDGNVVYQCTPSVRNKLDDLSADLSVVRKGMRAVVSGDPAAVPKSPMPPMPVKPVPPSGVNPQMTAAWLGLPALYPQITRAMPTLLCMRASRTK